MGQDPVHRPQRKDKRQSLGGPAGVAEVAEDGVGD